MTNNTSCKKCIFFDEKRWCEFSIPNSIEDQTKLEKEIYSINNYRCSYAFGLETFNEQNLFDKEYIKEQIIELNKINFTLLVDFDNLNVDTKKIYDILTNLNFKPVNILCFGKTLMNNHVEYFQKNVSIPWKLNKILPIIEYPLGIVSSIDTIINKYNSLGFLFIKSLDSLENIDDTINQIHIDYIINQNKLLYFKTQYYLDNLFMFYDFYKNIGIDKVVFFDEPKNFLDMPKYKNLSIKYYD
jgi:hypothetical protein